MSLMVPARLAVPVREPVADGDARKVDPGSVRDLTCLACRRIVRRWLGLGTVFRCAGVEAQWRADADAQGDSLLPCPACRGLFYLEPARHEGGTVQWAVTAFAAADRVTQLLFVTGFVLASLLLVVGHA
jgi:hypothetical protein